ncbi:hypothetical protein [Vibrio cholerae]|uniref:hypothetical protein n=1 Tax=Vibrio cholerae TaxID=666 RepID=UPI0022708486|nr:hypothetical protein [Vibrio cholerae]MCX9535799.1 hypothetical protein [Vibrio cholerae]
MIHEYAIEPNVILTWASNGRDYAEFFREYGLGTPRIISNFPKSKPAKFRSYLLKHCPANSESLQVQRYIEIVQKIAEMTAQRECRSDQGEDWCQLVTSETKRLPFSVILTSKEIGIDRNISLPNLYAEGSIWNHERQKTVQRTAANMLAVISNLVALSSEKIIVADPYGWTKESISFFQALVRLILSRQLNAKMPELNIFYKEKKGSTATGVSSPDAGYVKTQILSGVSANYDGKMLSVVCLDEKQGNDVFHNRYILSELGGLTSGHGFGVTENENHTDDIILMEESIYLKRWQLFTDETSYNVVSKA